MNIQENNRVLYIIMATMNINSPLSPFGFKGDISAPSANINPNLVNVDNSNYSGGFGSTETSREFSLDKNPISNVQAADASKLRGGAPRRCGGAKKNKSIIKLKIKNIVNKYKKMTSKMSRKLTLKKVKRRLSKMLGMKKSRHSRHSRRGSRRHGARKTKRMHGGGYHQYMGNVPNTPVYSTGSVNLPPNLSALANPVPFTVLQNTGACTDNYNHFTNSGKQIW
jgi:hypothetical protein